MNLHKIVKNVQKKCTLLEKMCNFAANFLEQRIKSKEQRQVSIVFSPNSNF